MGQFGLSNEAEKHVALHGSANCSLEARPKWTAPPDGETESWAAYAWPVYAASNTRVLTSEAMRCFTTGLPIAPPAVVRQNPEKP